MKRPRLSVSVLAATPHEVDLAVNGDLDLATADCLRRALDDLHVVPPFRVALKVNRIEFIDSTGLATLISAARRLTDAGGEMVLENPSAPLRRIVEVTGTGPLFHLEG